MPFTKRPGFELIRQQEVELKGARFINYHKVMKLKLNLKL